MGKLKNERGFTLIEIMVVILVIGVIMAITVPNFVNAGAKAHQKGCEANQRLVRAQLENYKLETGSYPNGANVTAVFDELEIKLLLQEHPECPADGVYSFKSGETEVTTDVQPVNLTCSKHGQLGFISN